MPWLMELWGNGLESSTKVVITCMTSRGAAGCLCQWWYGARGRSKSLWRQTVHHFVAVLAFPADFKNCSLRNCDDHLDFRKSCSCWVPKMLSEERKKKRAASALTFVTRYSEQGDGFLSQIVTGDQTWVSHLTPESKQQSMEWRHTSSPKKRKFKQTVSTSKIMCTVFWDRQAVLLVEFLPQGATLNSATSCETMKKLRLPAIQSKRLTRRLVLLRDNAWPHTAARTQALITSFGWEQFGHPFLQPRLSAKWLSYVPVPEEVPCWPAFPQRWRRQRSSE